MTRPDSVPSDSSVPVQTGEQLGDLSLQDLDELADEFFDTRRYFPESVEVDKDGLPIVDDPEENEEESTES